MPSEYGTFREMGKEFQLEIPGHNLGARTFTPGESVRLPDGEYRTRENSGRAILIKNGKFAGTIRADPKLL